MISPGRSDQVLRKLAAADESPCVSIYLPQSEAGGGDDKVRIQVKNALRVAERSLRERGCEGDDVEALMGPVREGLLNGARPTTDRAVALFRAPDRLEVLEVPSRIANGTFVGEEFHVTPLLSLSGVNQRFRVLALSQNETCLYEGDRFSFARADAPNLPTNMEAALGDDDNDDQTLQFHTVASGGGNARPAVFHGQARGKEDEKERIERYCQMIERALDAQFGGEEVPLVLAGSEPLLGIFRGVSTYRPILPEAIHGDPRYVREDELSERAWAFVEPLATQARDEALARFGEGLAKDRGTTDVSEAISAAREGRVASLFVAADHSASLAVDTSDDGASSRGGAREYAANRAVVETLRTGGSAYTVQREQLPRAALVGALYRY